MSCRYFGISRQAYYSWYCRYQAEGVEGVRTRSKAPKTSPNATHVEVVGKTIYLRQNYHFGPEEIAAGGQRAGSRQLVWGRRKTRLVPTCRADGTPRPPHGHVRPPAYGVRMTSGEPP
ncbi:hypothetical protein GCM10011579_032520 [Streptomyces albiflavescens]|uniref:Insertion element IS150 protein InsJ-like helix-turn-helix domain-containing protein n=1 Tax=Streptomyces albiflavescens TaxID=1623582 RepID=A0A917Y3L6_9ACTN|nr:leucine zipper domain-containing protein [Streptomyces albiflavescens]GGN63806.1 hypothetical protein GCM10011579_032520 [Streptomyces albiflavescens]